MLRWPLVAIAAAAILAMAAPAQAKPVSTNIGFDVAGAIDNAGSVNYAFLGIMLPGVPQPRPGEMLACVLGRRLGVYRQLPGTDVRIGRTRIDDSSFILVRPFASIVIPGRYYAFAPAHHASYGDQRLNCLAARSAIVSVQAPHA